jgi:hypothetical protein
VHVAVSGKPEPPFQLDHAREHPHQAVGQERMLDAGRRHRPAGLRGGRQMTVGRVGRFVFGGA